MRSVAKARGLFIIFFIMIIACKKKPESENATINFPSHPLRSEEDLDILMNKIGDAMIVLLGEASHGTAEYYEWRTAISKRLVREKGFTIIGVEGEWADSYRVNQFIKGAPKDSMQAVSLLKQYDRWPTWMWGNYEIASLITWLNSYNQGKPDFQKAGFYGLDVYCLWESMQELIPYIEGNDSLTSIAKEVRQCFQPFSADPMQYAYAVAYASANCRAQTQRLWQAILAYTGAQTATGEDHFVMQQNALVALNGERYYRSSVSSYPASWNIRDEHMKQTIDRLLTRYESDSKMIIWAHNTHVGDARYTDMATAGMINIGQLVRETYGNDNVYIVGFGSYSGTVVAADDWGGAVKTMNVPPAKKGSWEEVLHRQSAADKILFSKEMLDIDSTLKEIGHRAIGVQYNPSRERGNYVPTIVSKRYDAFIFIDRTKALRPIGTQPKNEPPDTYPSGY